MKPFTTHHSSRVILFTGGTGVTRWYGLILLAAVFLLLAGCDKTGDMREQPRYNPLASSDFFPDGSSARQPVAGAVPYAPEGAASVNDPTLTGMDQAGKPVTALPVPVDKALVTLGQERYNIYCVPCHGKTGEGNGQATLFGFPKPPNLLAANAKGLSNGDIFAIIKNGRGKMFSYGYRVKPAERWAVIAYIRAMQIKNGQVTPESLTTDELNQIGKQP